MQQSRCKRTGSNWCQHVSLMLTSAHDLKSSSSSSSQTRESSGASLPQLMRFPTLSPLSQGRRVGVKTGGQCEAEEKKTGFFFSCEGRRRHRPVQSNFSSSFSVFLEIWFVFKFERLVAAEAIWSQLDQDLLLSLQPNTASSTGKAAAAAVCVCVWAGWSWCWL